MEGGETEMIRVRLYHRKVVYDMQPYEAVFDWQIDDEDDLLGVSEQFVAQQMGWV